MAPPPPRRPAPGKEIPVQAEPLQLVSVSRQENGSWHFEVCEEAAKVLESYGQRHVAVCTVCGPYRTGKSYLLNLLLGRIQSGSAQFRVGSTTRACTQGLWMWGAGDLLGDGSSLLFMDCEGFNSTDADRTKDSKLMSLCLLISSVFLLNTKGVLSEGLFGTLSLVCNLAQHVEAAEGPVSRPALMWLLRDFILDLRDETERELSPAEYLERALRAKPLAGVDLERSKAASDVRQSLMGFFPERTCATLVQPIIDEEKLRRLAEVPYAELRPDFRAAFEAMHMQLLNLARARPKLVGGQALCASALVGVLHKLVDALNSNQVLSLGTAWDQVQHSACEGLAEELGAQAAAAAREVREGAPLPVPGGQPLPVPDLVLAKAMKEARRALKEEWLERSVGDEAVRAEYWKDLRQRLAEEEKALELVNSKLADEQLRATGADWEAWLGQEGEVSAADPRSEALALLVDKGLPARPMARAAREALNFARLARIRWDGSFIAVKAELQLATEELASKSAAADAAARAGDTEIAHTRELARLNGEVDAMREQAKQAIQREQELRAEVVEAEEATRKAERAHAEASRMLREQEQTIQDLEEQVSRKEAGQARPRTQPKCGCNVM